MPVNEPIRLPALPPWLDLERCEGCGDLYRDHRGAYTWGDACASVRAHAALAGDEGGGYRSKGPVLWALRALKVESWLIAHLGCRVERQEPPDESAYWRDNQ